MRSTTSAATIVKFRETFATHGLPETIISDNGPNFTSTEFENFLSKNGIKHTKVSPYHPASNGQAERAVRAFKEGVENYARQAVTFSAKVQNNATHDNRGHTSGAADEKKAEN